MIRFHKSFFEPYYKESFYKDLKDKSFSSAFGHLFIACLFAGFIAAILFYSFEKNKVEEYMISAVDTVSNEYPVNYKLSINDKGILESNITPVSFFTTKTDNYHGSKDLHKLIAIDSNRSRSDGVDPTVYDAHYLLLRDGYLMVDSGKYGNYNDFKGFSMNRSLLEIQLEKVRTLIPFIPRIISFLIFLCLFLLYPMYYLLASILIAAILYVVFNYGFNEKITYKSAYTLSVFAGGTTLFVSLLFFAVGLPMFPFFTTVVAVLFVILMHRNAEYFPLKLKKLKSKFKK